MKIIDLTEAVGISMVAFMSAVDLAFLTFAVVALEDSMTCMQK